MTKPKINLNSVNGDPLVLASLAYYALRNAGQSEKTHIVFEIVNSSSDMGDMLVRLADVIEATWDDPAALSVTDKAYDQIFEANQALGDYDPDDYPHSLDFTN
jgi:hypothetical protein